jgi:hypothetical protein
MNLFELYAEQTKPRHEIRRERTAAKRRSRREIAALRERSRREKAYRDETAKILEALAPEVREILDDLDNIARTGTGRALLDRLEQALPYLQAATRVMLMNSVARLIMARREAEGLPPFDDPIFDQPPRLFQHVKALLDPEPDP